jgi:hypothetical protein
MNASDRITPLDLHELQGTDESVWLRGTPLCSRRSSNNHERGARILTETLQNSHWSLFLAFVLC